IRDLEQHAAATTGRIATVSGRYFAMDRDKRWERIKLAYEAMTEGKGEYAPDAVTAVQNAYQHNITDEFIKPTVIRKEGESPVTIRPGEVVIAVNFRTDRGREITQVLTQTDMPEFSMKALPLEYITMTEYDKTYRNVSVIFATDNLGNTLGEVLQQHHKKQLRIAETEKY